MKSRNLHKELLELADRYDVQPQEYMNEDELKNTVRGNILTALRFYTYGGLRPRAPQAFIQYDVCDMD